MREFYRHPNMADGHLNKCKECVKAATRQREKNNPVGVLHSRLSAWKKNPTRQNLYRVVEAAKAAGLLVVPETCQMCGMEGPHTVDGRAWHAHHFDYDSPLSVAFVCTKCHGKLTKMQHE